MDLKLKGKKEEIEGSFTEHWVDLPPTGMACGAVRKAGKVEKIVLADRDGVDIYDLESDLWTQGK